MCLTRGESMPLARTTPWHLPMPHMRGFAIHAWRFARAEVAGSDSKGVRWPWVREKALETHINMLSFPRYARNPTTTPPPRSFCVIKKKTVLFPFFYRPGFITSLRRQVIVEETDELIATALSSMKDDLANEPAWSGAPTPTDDFLLMFLRAEVFSPTMAANRYRKFWEVRKARDVTLDDDNTHYY